MFVYFPAKQVLKSDNMFIEKKEILFVVVVHIYIHSIRDECLYRLLCVCTFMLVLLRDEIAEYFLCAVCVGVSEIVFGKGKTVKK